MPSKQPVAKSVSILPSGLPASFPKHEPEDFYTPPKNAVSQDLGPKRLTLDDIEILANTDPDAALKWLNLQSQLETARALHEKRTQDANFRLSMLQSTEAKMRREAQYRAACEQRGHRRDDGSLAIGGQRDASMVFHGVCCKCGKVWDKGIGSGPGQLPPFFANNLNSEMIGG